MDKQVTACVLVVPVSDVYGAYEYPNVDVWN